MVMFMKITDLNLKEISAVSGGIGFRQTVNAVYGVLPKVAFVTAKKLSMLYCVGKELKAGLQSLDGWSIVNLSVCIGATTLVRESAMALLIKKQKPE